MEVEWTCVDCGKTAKVKILATTFVAPDGWRVEFDSSRNPKAKCGCKAQELHAVNLSGVEVVQG